MWEGLPKHVADPQPEVFMSDNYIVVDFETTTKDNGDPRNADNSLLLACWSRGRGHPRYKHGSSYIEGSEYDMQELVEDINLAGFVVAHNAKFELGWLRRCGLELQSVVPFCTQIGEYVLAGNRRWGLSLSDCLRRRGFGEKDFVGTLIREGVPTELIPFSMLLRYCKGDVRLTEQLFLHQREHLSKRKQLPVTYTRNIFTPVLVDAERRGMALDKDRVTALYKKYHKEFIELSSRFEKITKGINFNSPKQVQEYLYDTLKFKELQDNKGKPIRNQKAYENAIKRWEANGRCDKAGNPCKQPIEGRKTDADTLVALEQQATTKAQTEFVEIKQKLNKVKDALSKILTKFKEVVDNNDLLYANLNQTRTATHRLSSTGHKSGIQFQNINREFKPCIKPRHKGWKIVENDEAQLEFRSAVQQAGCKKGLKDIKAKVDAHRQSFSFIFPEEFERLKDSVKDPEYKKYRQDSKADTFTPLYGGEYGSDNQMEYYKWFKKTYKGIVDWHDKSFNQVVQKGFLRIASGLIFYWPHARFTKWGKVTSPSQGNKTHRAICNYPVQSFCGADILPIGMLYLWHRLKAKDMQSFLINTVHDQVLGEVPEEELEEYSKIAEYALTQDVIDYIEKVYDYKMVVPLEAETEVFDHWGDYGNFEEFLNG